MFFVLFFWIWVVFNGNLTLEIALFGIGISAALYLFVWKVMGYSPRYDLKILRNSGLILKYLVILLWEIVKANIGVIKLVLNPNTKLHPKLAYFTTDLKGSVAKTVLANSITITPGTIIVSTEDDLFCIHAMNEDMAEGLDESTFVHQLRRMETRMEGKK